MNNLPPVWRQLLAGGSTIEVNQNSFKQKYSARHLH